MTLRALHDVPAPAKLNLFLHVVGRRADGYHLLESLFVLIDWADRLHFERREDGRLQRHDLRSTESLPAAVAVLPAEDRAYLTALREALAARLAAIAPGLDYGLIHADIVRENIFVRKDAVAFIDFDDCGFGFRLFDLATTLLRNRREPSYPALREALLSGYAAARPQARAELEHLPLFLLLRALTYIGWAAGRPDLPDNAGRLQRYVADARSLAAEMP